MAWRHTGSMEVKPHTCVTSVTDKLKMIRNLFSIFDLSARISNLSEWAVNFTLWLLTFLETEGLELFKQEAEWSSEETILVLLSGIRFHLHWQGQEYYGCALSHMYARSLLTSYERCMESQMWLWLLVPSIQVCPSIVYFPLQIETALLLSVIPVLGATVSRKNQHFCSLQNCVPQPTLDFNLHQ